MANIRENKKNGKTVSFRFTACLERDAQGKQVRRYTTWEAPDGLTPAKAKKAAERAADAWEEEIRAEYQKEKEAKDQGRAYMLPPEKRHDDFIGFVRDIWLPLEVCGGDSKPTTVAFYQHMIKPITEYFQGSVLQEISPIEVLRYLTYLRTQYRSKLDKPLSSKSIRHQYGVLTKIFGYAEKQEMIAKNPMKKVDAPKKEKKPVDALTQEQAARFFSLLSACPLDFRCILQLLITTGIRRGECMGLQWKDIDEKACTITIERNVSYTPESGGFTVRLTAQEIEQMKSVDIGAVDKETLAHASGFTFDPMLPRETRAQRILEHFKNPYCFRLGDMVIKLEFADEGPSLQELLTAFFLRQKSGL